VRLSACVCFLVAIFFTPAPDSPARHALPGNCAV
jgi:hypothetical protein